MQIRRALALLTLAIFLVGCGAVNIGGQAVATTLSMPDAAKQFVESALKGDTAKALEITCGTTRLVGQSVLQGITVQQGQGVDLSGLVYTEQNVQGANGEVRISGNVRITVSGVPADVDITSLIGPLATLKMKNDNGWKVCPIG
jgi:hypothetical protein